MRARGLWLPLATFAVLAAAWETLSRFGGLRPEVFPGPWRTLESGWGLLASGALARHAIASLFRVTVGFYLAVALGVPVGVLLGSWKTGRQAFGALIEFLRPISPLAWIPLAMLWFGIGDKPAVFLIFLAAFFTVLLPTMVAVNEIPATYLQVAANFDFSRREVFQLIILPAILPRVLPALRVSLGIAWLVVVAAEMIAVKSGLGFLVLDSRNALRMDFVLCAMISIGLIGITLDWLIGSVSRLDAVSWGRGGR